MSEYMAGIVLFSALISFAELISYSSGEDKGERLAISVVLIYCIVAPLIPLAESFADFDISEIIPEGEELSGGAYIEVSEEGFREGILSLVVDKWGLLREETVVTVTGFDFETMTAERIIITLLSRGVSVDFHEIENYIEKAGLGVCEVRYAIK